MTDDELIAAVEDRLNGGHFGFNGLYSTSQQDWREGVTDYLDWLHDMCNADFETYNPHRLKLQECLARYGGDQVQMRRQVFGVNTTYYGQVAEMDHAPQ